MKKSKYILPAVALIGITLISIVNGCKVPEAIASKTGAQLWAENCNRCHNAPDPLYYSDTQWDVAMEHMRVKALLTNVEVNKIAAFLKASN